MYTNIFGYKFYIGLDANGRGRFHGNGLCAELYVMSGEYDSLLKWPAEAWSSFIRRVGLTSRAIQP